MLVPENQQNMTIINETLRAGTRKIAADDVVHKLSWSVIFKATEYLAEGWLGGRGRRDPSEKGNNLSKEYIIISVLKHAAGGPITHIAMSFACEHKVFPTD